MTTHSRPILKILQQGLLMLTPMQLKEALALCVAFLFGSAFEALTIASIYPTATALIDAKSVLKNEYVLIIFNYVGEMQEQVFIYYAIMTVSILLTINYLLQVALLYGIKRFIASSTISQSKHLITTCLNAPYTWFQNYNSAILVRRVYGDVSKWHNGFLQGFLHIFQSIITMLVAAYLILALSPNDGLIILSVIGVMSVLVIVVSRPRILALGTKQRNISDIYMQSLFQTFVGIKDIKVSDRGHYFTNRADANLHHMQHARLLQSMWEGVPPLTLLTVGQLGFLILLYTFWSQGMEKGQFVGQMAFLGMVASRLIPAINRLTSALAGFWDSLPYVEGLLDITESIASASKTSPIKVGHSPLSEDWKKICFQDVSYHYPSGEQATLSNINMVLERGKFYGIVGFSGAGKSTLVDILLGLSPPTSGDILFGDIHYADIDIKSWQKNIGYVPQNPFIADDTVIANVAFGIDTKDIDIKQAWKALSLAEMEDVVRNLPNGLNSRLGENGVKLSGGQVQRIAIARALYRNPEVLILDEATSALDSETESIIQTAIENIHGQITTVAIAHRVSTLKNSDQIIVCDHGKLVQSGRFDELMECSEIFGRLARKDTDHDATSVNP
ncbi:MAG: ABC transporter ATP-binding protein/permease [Rhodospirillales bacterium]|nr:ABC transporter ATP-binding protein/permease [Rhodospirillales bacterium]